MRKTGTPWYRKGQDAWYVWHAGRQVFLAKGRANKGEAFARFAALLVAPGSGEPAARITVGEAVERFVTASQKRVGGGTVAAYRCVLRSFAGTFGDREPCEVTPEAVAAWAGRQRWSASTRRYALTVVSTAFAWAERTGLAPSNPVRGVSKPPAKSRGPEVLIAPELHARILSVASPEFRDFLTAVRGTGARPGEVARVTASDVSWAAGCWVLTEHKTAATGRVRTIYLPDAVLGLCRRLSEVRPSGPLFLTTRGEPWRKTAWRQAMARAQRALGLACRPLTSGYRHTFATDALEAGVPDAHVAELLGHTGTAMIHRHYGHLTARGQALRSALARVGKVQQLGDSDRPG